MLRFSAGTNGGALHIRLLPIVKILPTKRRWRLDLDPQYATYYQLERAISEFATPVRQRLPQSPFQLLIGTNVGSAAIRRRLNELPDIGVDLQQHHQHFRQLNESQQEAIRSALSYRLYCIHGPPGTGKTGVAVALTAGKTCLACAQSNVGAELDITRPFILPGS